MKNTSARTCMPQAEGFRIRAAGCEPPGWRHDQTLSCVLSNLSGRERLSQLPRYMPSSLEHSPGQNRRWTVFLKLAFGRWVLGA